MWLLNVYTAMFTFVQTMTVPAAIMMIYGLMEWRKGLQSGIERLRRRGKLLFIFGLSALFIFASSAFYFYVILKHVGMLQ